MVSTLESIRKTLLKTKHRPRNKIPQNSMSLSNNELMTRNSPRRSTEGSPTKERIPGSPTQSKYKIFFSQHQSTAETPRTGSIVPSLPNPSVNLMKTRMLSQHLLSQNNSSVDATTLNFT
jgi:hypothetical protein